MDYKTLGNKAVDELLNYIRNHGYDVGDKLPNEYELASQLKVSRNTIREALRTLASRNILDIRQGAGTFISQKKGVADDPLGFSFMEDHRKLAEDLIQIRCIIEPQIAELAAQNATAEEIQILGEITDQVEEVIRQRQNFTEKDIQFHTQLAICSQNVVMSNLIPVICEGITVFSSVVMEQEYEQTIKSHREIYECVRDRRPADAHQAMVYHLLYNRNRFIEENS